MNKDRRNQLMLWCHKAEELKDDLESILWDEQNSYDNIPENLQYSTRATESEQAIDDLEDAVDILNEAIEKVQEVV